MPQTPQVPNPSQAASGCAVVAPEITSLSSQAKQTVLAALVDSGITGALQLKTSTDQEKSAALESGLKAVAKCDERITSLLGGFESLLRSGGVYPAPVNAPAGEGGTVNRDTDLNSSQPIGPAPAEQAAGKNQPLDPEKFQKFVKLFLETFELRSVQPSKTDLEGINKLYLEQRQNGAIFQDPHTREIKAFIGVLSPLQGESPVEKALGGIELYKIASLKFTVTDSAELKIDRSRLSAIVNLAVGLGLYGLKSGDIRTFLLSEGTSAAFDAHRGLLENYSYISSLREALTLPDKSKDDGQRLTSAIYMTQTFAVNSQKLLLQEPSVPVDFSPVLGLFQSLDLNAVRVLGSAKAGVQTGKNEVTTPNYLASYLERKELLPDAAGTKNLGLQADAAVDFDPTVRGAKPEGGQKSGGNPVPAETPANFGLNLSPDQISAAAAYEAAAAAGDYKALLNSTRFKEAYDFAGKPIAREPQQSSLLFSPLPAPLGEMERLPLWNRYIQTVKEDPTKDGFLPEQRDERALVRLATGYTLFLAANWNTLSDGGREGAAKWISDPRFNSALAENERNELGVYALFQSVDREFYRYSLSRHGAAFSPQFDQESAAQYSRRMPEISALTSDLRTIWNVKSSTPEVAMEILNRRDLEDFYRNPARGKEFQQLADSFEASRPDLGKKNLEIRDAASFYEGMRGSGVFTENQSAITEKLGADAVLEILKGDNRLFKTGSALLKQPGFLNSFASTVRAFGPAIGVEGRSADLEVFRFLAKSFPDGVGLPLRLDNSQLTELVDFYCVRALNGDTPISRDTAESRLTQLLRLRAKELDDIYRVHESLLGQAKVTPQAGFSELWSR